MLNKTKTMLHVGFGNYVALNKILVILDPESDPVRKFKKQAQERGRILDATKGKKTKSVIVIEGDFIVLSALNAETLIRRIEGAE